MKINNYKKYSLLFALLVLLFTACESIVDEKELENTTDVDGVNLVVGQNSSGGNLLVLEMNTPGVTGYWDYNLGTAKTNKVEVVYPIPGTSTFTFIGTLGAEFFEKTIDVTIDVLDTPLEQDWYDLVSENTSAGKTWVFDGAGGDNGLWWFMSDPGNPWGVWWNAGGTCCPPGDAAGSMTFNLDGAANYVYDDGNGNVTNASFVLDTENQRLHLNGASILGYDADRVNPDGVYNIIELTEDKMVLFTPTNGGGTGWTWVLVPAE
ncbi:hypothetical protein [Draconibacterium sp.]|uniref:hypothetical protein n=1 Tax=Draconibacterium sp. TaxID=1965318 RepID=UPI0035691948